MNIPTIKEFKQFLSKVNIVPFVIVSVPDWNGGRECEIRLMDEAFSKIDNEWKLADYEYIYEVIKTKQDLIKNYNNVYVNEYDTEFGLKYEEHTLYEFFMGNKMYYEK